jgi:hypothetical protein
MRTIRVWTARRFHPSGDKQPRRRSCRVHPAVRAPTGLRRTLLNRRVTYSASQYKSETLQVLAYHVQKTVQSANASLPARSTLNHRGYYYRRLADDSGVPKRACRLDGYGVPNRCCCKDRELKLPSPFSPPYICARCLPFLAAPGDPSSGGITSQLEA